MDFNVEGNTLVMKLPTLIKRSCIPKENEPSHSPFVVDEKHEMAFLGFIKLGLNEKEAHDFSKEFLHDWATQ